MKRASYEKTYNSHYQRRMENRPVQFWIHYDPITGLAVRAAQKDAMGAIPSKNSRLAYAFGVGRDPQFAS